jgi:hypothetical protein
MQQFILGIGNAALWVMVIATIGALVEKFKEMGNKKVNERI